MFNKKSLLTILVVITLVFFSTMAIAQDLGFTVGGSAGTNLVVGISMAPDTVVDERGKVTANLNQWTGFWTDGSASGSAGDGTVEWSTYVNLNNYHEGGVNWNFAENMALKWYGCWDWNTGITYEMVVPDTLTLGVNIAGGKGIKYSGETLGFSTGGAENGTGFDPSTDKEEIRIGVGVSNILAGPATLGAGVGYGIFIPNRADAKGNDTLDFKADVNVAMEDLMSVGVGGWGELQLGADETKIGAYLSFGLLAVPDLSLNLEADLIVETKGADDDAKTTMWIPIELSVGYALDLGFGTLNPFLKLGGDIGEIAYDDDDKTHRRPWYLAVGADMKLAGGSVTIPFGIIATNNTDNPGSLDAPDWLSVDHHGKLIITTGIQINF